MIQIAVYVLKMFAVFYMAEATVEVVNHADANGWWKLGSLSRKLFFRKPFTCALCMMFWWAIPMVFVSEYWYYIPALAGGGLILYRISYKLSVLLG
ncbi:MAG: hypothetical protein ACXABY_08000 [Candidatus Thorarchaeota archaeon]|jgi:hypothetical protein